MLLLLYFIFLSECVWGLRKCDQRRTTSLHRYDTILLTKLRIYVRLIRFTTFFYVTFPWYALVWGIGLKNIIMINDTVPIWKQRAKGIKITYIIHNMCHFRFFLYPEYAILDFPVYSIHLNASFFYTTTLAIRITNGSLQFQNTFFLGEFWTFLLWKSEINLIRYFDLFKELTYSHVFSFI